MRVLTAKHGALGDRSKTKKKKKRPRYFLRHLTLREPMKKIILIVSKMFEPYIFTLGV